MSKYKKLAILIPCHNEESGIGKVIDTIPVSYLQRHHIKTEIIVIDNNSTDRTVERALKRNVRVVSESRKGKGYAIRKGFESISSNTRYVVMLDGDATYASKEIPRLLEPLINDFCDVIVGSRLSGKIYKNSFKIKNRVANWGYTFLTRVLYRANVTDVLSGYFAWKYEVVKELNKHLVSRGFNIEMEMITKIVKLGYSIYSVPVSYQVREGESKLSSFKDGVVILYTTFANFNWRPSSTIAKTNSMRGSFSRKLSPGNKIV